jgi:hypothetical protein
MDRGAVLDADRVYRYLLWRRWDTKLPSVLWVMLNPSVADSNFEDPTIRRCIGFTKLWGFGGLEVVNLYAFRSPEPAALVENAHMGIDVVGPENDEHLRRSYPFARTIVAWGSHSFAAQRAEHVVRLFGSRRLYCLGTNKDGNPKHPLYVKSVQPLVEFHIVT